MKMNKVNKITAFTLLVLIATTVASVISLVNATTANAKLRKEISAYKEYYKSSEALFDKIEDYNENEIPDIDALKIKKFKSQVMKQR